MTYFGGKAGAGVYQTIINEIPLHRCYIEPFLGGGAIMRHKRPAELSIGIDMDGAVLTRQNGRHDIQLIHMDALSFLTALTAGIGKLPYGSRDIFVYCDPPYPHDTRSTGHRYLYELEDQQHRELISIIKKLDCMVMISSYPNDLYLRELSEWRTIEYQAMTRGGILKTEVLFMNYQKSRYLHDDSFLGVDANNRQDINRRISRTIRRIRLWSTYERIKMLRILMADLPMEDLEYLFGSSIGQGTYHTGGIGACADCGRQIKAEEPVPDPPCSIGAFAMWRPGSDLEIE